MNQDNLNKTVAQVFENRYTIPLYQRNFAWREEQITRLLRDVYDSFRKDKDGKYFIGSLVVMKKSEDEYEVIDGQQRLTVLSLITKVLEINSEQRLNYDSRPFVEEFLKELYAEHSLTELNHPSVFYLKEALNIIKTANLDEEREGNSRISIYDENGKINKQFANYFANNVIIVRVEMPEETDVATYFEIMNNRGEQLQEHEILKAQITGLIKEKDSDNYDWKKQQEFALIWDACSQIDEPIQKAFNAIRRVDYLGYNFDEYNFEGLAGIDIVKYYNDYTINEILNNRCDTNTHNPKNVQTEEEDFIDEAKYSSIIDFPNFLMHIFKAFYEDKYLLIYKEEISLDAKYLLRTYERLKEYINPEQFIKQLFRTKVMFDRYIVKTKENEKDEDGISWVLVMPKRYGSKMSFANTFGDTPQQARILKALTMLQVSFRNRKYKNWLQKAIQWYAKQDSINTVGAQKVTSSYIP